MNKTLLLVTSAVFMFHGCSSEDDGSSFSRDLTFKITDDNASKVVASAYYEDSLSALSEYTELVNATQRQVQKTVRETTSGKQSCETSGSLSGSVSDSSDSDSVSADLTFDNCVNDGLTIDGGLKFNIDSAEDSMGMAFSYKALSVASNGESAVIDGDIGLSIGLSETAVHWDYYVQSSALDNQTVHSYSTTSLTSNSGDQYPTSGAWKVDGAESTYLTAEVVANGIEISVNGNQKQLISWSDF